MRPYHKNKQLTRDDNVELIGVIVKCKYPKVHLVCYADLETGKEYEFITNNMRLEMTTIAVIYKSSVMSGDN